MPLISRHLRGCYVICGRGEGEATTAVVAEYLYKVAQHLITMRIFGFFKLGSAQQQG